AGWPRSARYRPRPRTFHSTPPFSGWKCGATWWTFIVSSSRKAPLRRATFGAACGARLIAFARPIGSDPLGEGFIRAPIFAGQNEGGHPRGRARFSLPPAHESHAEANDPDRRQARDPV